MVTWNNMGANAGLSAGITQTQITPPRPPLQAGAVRERGAAPRLFINGFDIGQVNDNSAIATIEQTFEPEDPTNPESELVTKYALRHLYRWPLQTKYPVVVKEAGELVSRPAILNHGESLLVVDITGVGRPIGDMLDAANLPARVVKVLITSGNTLAHQDDDGVWYVPKRELVSVLQLLLQSRRFVVSKRLKGAAILVKELLNFKVKITTSANEVYGAWRENSHDDAVLACCLSLWAAEAGLAGSLGDTGEPIPLGRRRGEAAGWEDKVMRMNPLL